MREITWKTRINHEGTFIDRCWRFAGTRWAVEETYGPMAPWEARSLLWTLVDQELASWREELTPGR